MTVVGLYLFADNGIVDTSVKRVDGLTLGEAIEKYAIGGKEFNEDYNKKKLKNK